MLKLIEEEKEETVKKWAASFVSVERQAKIILLFFAEVPDKLVGSWLGRLIDFNQ